MDDRYGYKSSALGMGVSRLCVSFMHRWGEIQILNVYTPSLCLKLTFLLSQKNFDTNPPEGWRQSDMLTRNRAQSLMNTTISMWNSQVISTLFDYMNH